MRFQSTRIALALFLFGICVLAADQAPLTGESGGDDESRICAEKAKEAGIPDADAWVWSPSLKHCINTGGPGGSPAHICAPLVKELDDWLKANPRGVPKLPLTEQSGELTEECIPLLQGQIDVARPNNANKVPVPQVSAMGTNYCPEGYNKCMANCNQWDMGDWEGGGRGAYVGCVAACGIYCSGDNNRGGCHKGWCWAGCNTGFPLAPRGSEWCYTTKTYSQSYNYVRCSRDNECGLDWYCGGPCAAF